MNSNIIVIGDSIIDKYIYGQYSRLNPENDKGLVIEYISEKLNLGGALSVAYLISSFNQDVFIFSSVGKHFADFIKQRLDHSHIGRKLEIHQYNTVKTRLIIDKKIHKDRLDFDFFAECRYPEALQINTNDIIVIQDYGKGFCTKELLEYIGKHTNKIIVDPYINTDWKKYPHPFLIKCNHREAQQALGYSCDILLMGRKLSQLYNCHIVITNGDDGIYYYNMDNKYTYHVPARKTKVKDVCGAGDTVLATIATGLAKNIDISECCKLASITASEQIKSIGINKIKNVFI